MYSNNIFLSFVRTENNFSSDTEDDVQSGSIEGNNTSEIQPAEDVQDNEPPEPPRRPTQRGKKKMTLMNLLMSSGI